MGIFYEQVEYINRDYVQREIRFDGQRVYVKPNYTEDGTFLSDVHNFAPKICIPYALNQNVIMGSEDAINPSAFESYVVPLTKNKKGKQRFDISFCPSGKVKAKTRVDLETYLNDPSLKVLDGRGPFRVSEAALPSNMGIANQAIDEA